MNVIYDNSKYEWSKECIDGLKQFIIGYMDAARKSEPNFAYCWNYCSVTIDDMAQISTNYGQCLEDIISNEIENPTLIVTHPKIIKEPG